MGNYSRYSRRSGVDTAASNFGCLVGILIAFSIGVFIAGVVLTMFCVNFLLAGYNQAGSILYTWQNGLAVAWLMIVAGGGSLIKFGSSKSS